MNEQRAKPGLREHTCHRLGLIYARDCPECVAELPKHVVDGRALCDGCYTWHDPADLEATRRAERVSRWCPTCRENGRMERARQRWERRTTPPQQPRSAAGRVPLASRMMM
jgi:hypothetical protein